MEAYLVRADCAAAPANRDEIRAALPTHDLLWVDFAHCDEETLDSLREDFAFHPLAVEDAQEFDQRPKADEYDDFTYLVAYGAGAPEAAPHGSPLAEVHFFYTEHYLVTLHQGDLPAVAEVRGAMQRRTGHSPTALITLWRVLDGLGDSMFPYLADFDDRIDDLQDQVFTKPRQEQLSTLFAMKRELIEVRRLVTPQRDTLNSLLSGTVGLAGMTAEHERYFRDLYDHLIRISDMVDSYRDLLSGSMDAYMSMVSNRLNSVMKQLTIISTVFLPLSFITGFFGQNFAWMVDRIESLRTFAGFGLGSQLVAIALLLLLFWKRGWLGDRT
jgi:magnesium transporter